MPVVQRGRLPDYLPDGTLIILDETAQIEEAAAGLDAEAERLRLEKLERGELPNNFPRPYFTWEELEEGMKSRQRLSLEAWGAGETLDFMAAPGYAGKLPSFLKKTAELLSQRQRVIIISHQASRLADLLDAEGVVAAPVEEVALAPRAAGLVLAHGSLPEGWVLGEDTYLFTDAEIFGFVKQRRLLKKRPSPGRKLAMDFAPDDFVVHVEHGIGRFTGVTTMNSAGSEKEFLVLHYAGSDVLYVPTDQIDRVSRYVGAGDRTPVLSRLGTQEWSRTRQRAKEAAEALALELLELYASREVVPGVAFSRDTLWQQELESAFPYIETPDQLDAIREVKQDMEKHRPMDRLVSRRRGLRQDGDRHPRRLQGGDGRTAGGRARADHRPGAAALRNLLGAPQRLSGQGRGVEPVPLAGEQRDIIEGLGAGAVDICIGTHRLLQKDVSFKDLGLLIIDEEQRFGVNHKEYLKKMRQEVDVLTLSATPIPRTLHMSLAGVRDMSTMETPPSPPAGQDLRSRVQRASGAGGYPAEMERNGQVFFLHNGCRASAWWPPTCGRWSGGAPGRRPWQMPRMSWKRS
jgi:transcription-repair coupling factor (superfamily II helicase)